MKYIDKLTKIDEKNIYDKINKMKQKDDYSVDVLCMLYWLYALWRFSSEEIQENLKFYKEKLIECKKYFTEIEYEIINDIIKLVNEQSIIETSNANEDCLEIVKKWDNNQKIILQHMPILLNEFLFNTYMIKTYFGLNNQNMTNYSSLVVFFNLCIGKIENCLPYLGNHAILLANNGLYNRAFVFYRQMLSISIENKKVRDYIIAKVNIISLLSESGIFDDNLSSQIDEIISLESHIDNKEWLFDKLIFIFISIINNCDIEYINSLYFRMKDMFREFLNQGNVKDLNLELFRYLLKFKKKINDNYDISQAFLDIFPDNNQDLLQKVENCNFDNINILKIFLKVSEIIRDKEKNTAKIEKYDEELYTILNSLFGNIDIHKCDIDIIKSIMPFEFIFKKFRKSFDLYEKYTRKSMMALFIYSWDEEEILDKLMSSNNIHNLLIFNEPSRLEIFKFIIDKAFDMLKYIRTEKKFIFALASIFLPNFVPKQISIVVENSKNLQEIHTFRLNENFERKIYKYPDRAFFYEKSIDKIDITKKYHFSYVNNSFSIFIDFQDKFFDTCMNMASLKSSNIS